MVKGNMKTWKLVAGILSIILSVFILFQSSIVGMINAIDQSDDIGGTAGLFVAIFCLAGGITSIAGRKSKGTNVALLILFGLAGLIGCGNAEVYKDLMVWGWWCYINAGLAFICLFTYKRTRERMIIDDRYRYDD